MVISNSLTGSIKEGQDKDERIKANKKKLENGQYEHYFLSNGFNEASRWKRIFVLQTNMLMDVLSSWPWSFWDKKGDGSVKWRRLRKLEAVAFPVF